ncbi:MAG TPA: SGNH/GDSL hydrolase family protein [Trebonia sp.]|nr:SGNH/GDSL hydrolase family protein [Trebonia sp.]
MNWVVTWGTGLTPGGVLPGTPWSGRGVTIRNVVHTSIGGSSARITLSNAFGTAELAVTGASVALPASVAGTMIPLTFGGAESAVISPGSELTSDPVRLEIPADADVLVSVGVRPGQGPVTFHLHASQESYVAVGDGHAADVSRAEFTGRTESWFYVAEVQVPDRGAGTVVALGDSITDGTTSTPGTNRRWPDYLARRLLAPPDGQGCGVLNAGISGNRVLLDGAAASPDCAGAGESGLARLDRDVLDRAGVRTLVICAGINDIIWEPHYDATPIIDGLSRIAARAHECGIRVIGATLTPACGFSGGLSAVQETARAEVNAWIRDGSAFDAVADFDAVLRDPAHPERLAACYDSGDHLHPSDRGFEALAAAICLGGLTKGLEALSD